MKPIAIVTGASRGIGAATAKLLADNGYDLCVNYRRDRDAAESVATEIRSRGRRALAVQADVADPAEVARMFRTVDESLGPLTALVNNAGIIGPRCRVDELETSAFEQVMAVNVLGLVWCSQEAVRRMSTRHDGHGGAIVNVSSGSAYLGNPGNSVHYAVSKGAVNSFTIGLSQEIADEGVRVNAVSPGLTRTDMPEEQAIETAAEVIPIGRAAEPEEIAEVIVWLLSEHAAHVAGANIRVAGGRL